MKRVPREIDLREVIDIIRKRLWIVVIITLISTAAGTWYSINKSNNTPSLYQSSTRLIIGASSDLMKTLQVIIKDPLVLDKVVKELGLEKSPEALASQITVNSIESSQVISINVTDTDPERAAKIANTTAKIFKEEIPKIMDFEDVRFLSEAKVIPFSINEPQSNRTIIIAFIFGIAVSIGLAFLLDSFDNTIRPDHDIEEITGLPLLGRVPKMNKKNIKKKSKVQQAVTVRGETIVPK
jgi:capsular polysaccharide biosynthesis protein